jgi:hypothetical protein
VSCSMRCAIGSSPASCGMAADRSLSEPPCAVSAATSAAVAAGAVTAAVRTSAATRASIGTCGSAG